MDKIWLKNYQKTVPEQINPDEHTTLVTLFEESCHKFAGRTAYESFHYQLSYQELDDKSKQFACYLQQLGLQKGARVAIMLPNILQYPIALFGILRAGYVVVNMNPLYTVDEVHFQLADSEAEAIIVLANCAHTLEQALAKTAVKHVIISQIGDALPSIKGLLLNFALKYFKKMVPSYQLPQAISYRRALKKGQGKMLRPLQITAEDTAFLQYTGGTTGVAKAAILSQHNMVANILQAYYWILPLDVGPEDIIVTALPLYHIFSLSANCLTFLKAGAKNILITNPRDIPGFIRTIKNSQFTAITGVNTLFNALMNNEKFKEIDFSKLKLAISGGMALQKSVAHKWQTKTKTRLLEAYGLTEACPAVSINPLYVTGYNGSVGLPLPSTSVTIRNETGQEVDIGEAGELCIKGPQVMSGYWQRPDETALVFTPDGYLKTGDIVQMDSEGYLYLVDRKKDLIVVSGFNVYPNEVEQIIGLMPEVHEVGVVGVPDPETGETVKAYIVKQDLSLSTKAVIAHCRKHLTAYKVPKIIEFMQELPKTSVGKILRRGLR